MIRGLDNAILILLLIRSPPGSELAQAAISFDLPDAEWRAALEQLTVNCYLYDICENTELATAEPLVQRKNGTAVQRKPPVRIDCAYCITAWSIADNDKVGEEHRLLSQILQVLVRNRPFPPDVLEQMWDFNLYPIPPNPTSIARADGSNRNEFWDSLDHPRKPSLNYVATLAVMADEEPADWTPAVGEDEEGRPKIAVGIDNLDSIDTSGS